MINIVKKSIITQVDIVAFLFAVMPAIIVGVFAIALWKYVFESFFRLRNKLSLNIREKIIPDIQNTNNYIITLSSSIIVLTFSISKLFERPNDGHAQLIDKGYLVTSWVLFATCILIGVIIGIATYVYKLHYLSSHHAFESTFKKENNKISDAELDEFKKLKQWTNDFEKILFFLMYLSPVTFFISLLYLVLFAINNI